MSAQRDLFVDPAIATRDAAARTATKTAGRIRGLVLDAIRAAGEAGLTADEAAGRLKLSVLTVRPRVTELKRAGAIQPSGTRRVNHSGLYAAVYIARESMDWLSFLLVLIGAAAGVLIVVIAAIGFIFIVAFRWMMRPHNRWRR